MSLLQIYERLFGCWHSWETLSLSRYHEVIRCQKCRHVELRSLL